ncbi:MAG: hypothetical protein V1793_15335 [Pseudomonadota bacterium]
MANQMRIAVFILLIVSMIDTFVFSMFDSGNILKVMVGSTETISGKLGGDLRLISEDLSNKVTDEHKLQSLLDYAPHYSNLDIHFIELKGRLWRATLHADNVLNTGDYPIRVFASALGLDMDAPPSLIRLFPDKLSYENSFRSVIRRYFGIAPFWITLIMIPVSILYYFLAFRKASNEEQELISQGIGPIYKVSKQKEKWEIIIGLGISHGIRTGESLVLLNRDKEPAGEIVVSRVKEDHSYAFADISMKIRPDFYVKKNE